MHSRRRRLLAVALAAAAAAALVGCTQQAHRRPAAQHSPPTASVAPSVSPAGSPSASAAAKPLPALPRGGRQLFPHWRVVAYYGGAHGKALGVLGAADPESSALRVRAAGAAFVRPGRPVQPAFELIATVANGFPTHRGTYSTPSSDADIARYLAAARRHRLLLILDVQPGRAEFLPEVQRYDKWLRQPDVGLAMDPEWKMGAGQVPGQQIGHTDAYTVNAVSAYLAGLVTKYRLPQKLFVVHEFRASMVVGRTQVLARPGLATVFHVDGFGGQGIKIRVYGQLHGGRGFASGFKLFYTQDHGLMAPAQVLALVPPPDLITYQ